MVAQFLESLMLRTNNFIIVKYYFHTLKSNKLKNQAKQKGTPFIVKAIMAACRMN